MSFSIRPSKLAFYLNSRPIPVPLYRRCRSGHRRLTRQVPIPWHSRPRTASHTKSRWSPPRAEAWSPGVEVPTRDLNRFGALKPPVVPGRRQCCNSVHLVIGSIGDSPTTQQPTRAPKCPPPAPYLTAGFGSARGQRWRQGQPRGPNRQEAKLYADLVSSQNLHKQKLWRRPTQDLLGVDKVCPHSLRNS